MSDELRIPDNKPLVPNPRDDRASTGLPAPWEPLTPHELYARSRQEFERAAKTARWLSGWRTPLFALALGAAAALSVFGMIHIGWEIPHIMLVAVFGAGVTAGVTLRSALHAEAREMRDRMEMYGRAVEAESLKIAASSGRADRLEAQIGRLHSSNKGVTATIDNIVTEAMYADAELRATALLRAYTNHQLDGLSREVFAALSSLYSTAGKSTANVAATFDNVSFGGFDGLPIPTFSPLKLNEVELGVESLRGFAGASLAVNAATVAHVVPGVDCDLGSPSPKTRLRFLGLKSEGPVVFSNWEMAEQGFLSFHKSAAAVTLRNVSGGVNITTGGEVVLEKCKLSDTVEQRRRRRLSVAGSAIETYDGRFCGVEFETTKMVVHGPSQFEECILPVAVVVHDTVSLTNCVSRTGAQFADGEHRAEAGDSIVIAAL